MLPHLNNRVLSSCFLPKPLHTQADSSALLVRMRKTTMSATAGRQIYIARKVRTILDFLFLNNLNPCNKDIDSISDML